MTEEDRLVVVAIIAVVVGVAVGLGAATRRVPRPHLWGMGAFITTLLALYCSTGGQGLR